jgi:GMP synthase-like glutamine amidotransferase
MSRILVLQHVKSEGLGIIGKALRQRGIAVDFLKIFKGDRISKSINGYDGLIVLGGPMGVYEEDVYPFIKDEITLIKNALKNNVPVLGICLGAQLLAKAAGADVYKGKKKEIGWYKVELTDEGKRDGLFIGLPDEFTVFQWHGDTFDLGTDLKSVPSKCLALSELFPHQIIKVGKNAYGLQFHLEVTEEMIREWIDVNDKELLSVKSYINPKKILKDTPEHIETIHKYGEIVFLRFLALLANR